MKSSLKKIQYLLLFISFRLIKPECSIAQISPNKHYTLYYLTTKFKLRKQKISICNNQSSDIRIWILHGYITCKDCFIQLDNYFKHNQFKYNLVIATPYEKHKIIQKYNYLKNTLSFYNKFYFEFPINKELDKEVELMELTSYQLFKDLKVWDKTPAIIICNQNLDTYKIIYYQDIFDSNGNIQPKLDSMIKR